MKLEKPSAADRHAAIERRQSRLLEELEKLEGRLEAALAELADGVVAAQPAA